MSKNPRCPACLALERGFRSRVAFKHTCGLEPAAVKMVDDELIPLTFTEIKDSVIQDQRVPMAIKGQLLNEKDEDKFISILVDKMKVDE